MSIFFETKRLIVNFPTEADFAALHALETDIQVMQFIGAGTLSSPERTLAKLRKDIEHFARHHFGTGLVYEKASQSFVGLGGLTYLEYNDEQPEIELDCLLHAGFWGKGLGTELVKGAIEWGFENLAVSKLVAVVDPHNLRSQEMVKKIGLEFVGERWCYSKWVKWYEIQRI